jgi:glutathione peroxidase
MGIKGSLLGPAAVALTIAASAHAGGADNAFRFSFTSIDGESLPLDQFRGKAVLVVNTASQCGFARQFADLQSLWERYRDRGLIVLAVPSNDFGSQEPGTESEIKELCTVNFDVDFPMTSKVQIKGDAAHPFYQWAAMHFGPGSRPLWNFHKYLIGTDGRLVDWFSTMTSPTADRVVKAIERNLPADGSAG